MTVAIDDTLFRRRGKKAWAASWFHDGSAQGKRKTGRGNNWVVLAVIVKLPAAPPVALPVLAKLVIKGTQSASRLWLARRMTQQLAGALPGRDIHVAADSAYAGEELSKLGSQVTWTTRLRKDAALHRLPPGRTGRRGRPRVKGGRLPSLAGLAATAKFTPVTVTRYGKAATIQAATRACLWYSVFGAGQARNRTANAVRRTVPFQLACQTLATIWYAAAGHDPPTSKTAALAPPGTAPRPNRPPPIWPPSSAVSSSPPDLSHLTLTSQHPKKSAPSA